MIIETSALLSLLSLLNSVSFAFGGDSLAITNVSDFEEFSRTVNNGTNYSGKTVFLNSDLDFAEASHRAHYPIGTQWGTHTFQGTFDGKGHVISGLKITTAKTQVCSGVPRE